VFAPNSAQRKEITPGQRGRRVGVPPTDEPKTDAERRSAMSWAQRLKRVFIAPG